MTHAIEGLLREHAPQALAAVVRRYGHFADVEDAMQQAQLEALDGWPRNGVPQNPRGWLVVTATRRLIDEWRSSDARQRREETLAVAESIDPATPSHVDDSLTLFLLCCHPTLSRSSQVALTLRAVGGLTTAEIARATFVPEATMAQRISRAKSKVADVRFELPSADELADRIAAVEPVLYLVFTEGHAASSGEQVARVDLTAEAIRLTRQLVELAPARGETRGLLALMLLTDARRPARTTAEGALVPLADQDRALWDRTLAAEGIELVTEALSSGPAGAFQVQAAIAAVHAEAPDTASTDWAQVVGLYDELARIAPGPMVTLSRVVAVSMLHGPERALLELDVADSAHALAAHHRLPAVRAHLLEQIGDVDAAREQYRRAAELTRSAPEQRYLLGRAAELDDRGHQA